MSGINIIGKMIKADEEKDRIKLKLDEIRKMRDSFNIDLNRVLNMIDKDKLNKEEIKTDNEKYKIIGKLSFDLYIDYEYYKEFSIKNKSHFKNCSEELKSLGYELKERDEWVNVRRPNIDAIIDQIFLSYLCRSILSKCKHCDSVTLDDQSICDNCINISNEKKVKTIVKRNGKTNKRECASLNLEAFKKMECEICSTEVRYGEKYCSICNNLSDDIVESFSRLQNKKRRSKCRNKNEKYESNNPQNSSNCQNRSGLCNDNKIVINEIAKCNNCESNKEVIDEGMCGDCFASRYSDWVCPYRFCKKINIGNDKYCESCGIERSPVLIFGVPIWRCKNHIRDQIWICGKCEIINKLGKVCNKCGIAIHKSLGTKTIQLENRRVNEINTNRVYNKSNINLHGKWKCDICRLINDISSRRCECCRRERIIYWNCSHCTTINEVFSDRCDACGEINEKKYCVKCGWRELNSEGLCDHCVLIDNYGTDCFYRLGILEHGTPIMLDIKRKSLKYPNNSMWICFDCGKINKWEDKECKKVIKSISKRVIFSNDIYCNSPRDKYFKWCKQCGYKYHNTKSNCLKCFQPLNLI